MPRLYKWLLPGMLRGLAADDPRAVAEATQKLWNEARKHEENTNAI